MLPASSNVTQLLVAWNDGNPEARDELIPLVYAELHRLAQAYLRRERKFGSFTRSVAIPRPVRADQAVASFKDSILTITLPKTDDPQPKVINVQQVDS